MLVGETGEREHFFMLCSGGLEAGYVDQSTVVERDGHGWRPFEQSREPRQVATNDADVGAHSEVLDLVPKGQRGLVVEPRLVGNRYVEQACPAHASLGPIRE